MKAKHAIALSHFASHIAMLSYRVAGLHPEMEPEELIDCWWRWTTMLEGAEPQQ